MEIQDSHLSKRASFGSMLSFGMLDLKNEIFGAIIGTYMLFFWETKVQLDPILVLVGYIIYAVWNSVNDTLIGYFTDRPHKYWNRFGKRFPIIVLGGIPFLLAVGGLFTPPDLDPNAYKWLLFVWFIFFSCTMDFFISMCMTSHSALYPDKFRSDTERRRLGSIRMILQLFGTAIGGVVPALLINYEIRSTYSRMVWMFAAIGVLLFITYLPGHYEPVELRARYSEDIAKNEEISFVSVFRTLIMQKNFMIVVLIFFLDDIIGNCLSGSINYIVQYDLHETSDVAAILLAGFLGGALLTIIPWEIFSEKLNNNRKMLIIGIFLNTIALLPLIFVKSIIAATIGTFFLGVGGAALRIGRNPVMADVIDEVTIKTGKHLEGSFSGVYTFFNRLSLIAQGALFIVIHELTGFDPNAAVQTPLALFGFRMHLALIPMILCLLGLILFVKLYDLTPEKTQANQQLLKELHL